MADREVKIRIRAEDDASGKIRRVATELEGIKAPLAALPGLAGAIPQLLTGIGTALAAVGVGRALTALTAGILETAQAAGESQAATAKLAQAFTKTGEDAALAVPRFDVFAQAMQRQTGIDDDLIKSQASVLISIGRLTGQGLERATQAALDLGAVTGNQEQAFFALSKAAAGNSQILQRLGIVIDESVPPSQRYEAALAQIEQRMGGSAAAAADTYLGRIQALKTSFGNLQEAVGGPFQEAFEAALRVAITPTLDGLTDTVKASEAYRQAILGVAEGVATAALSIAELADLVSKDGAVVGAFFDLIQQKAAQAGIALQILNAGVRQLSINYRILTGDVSGALDMADDLLTTQTGTAAATDSYTGRVRALIAELKKLREEGPHVAATVRGAGIAADEAADRLTTLDKALKEMGATTTADLQKQIRDLEVAFREAGAAFARGEITKERFGAINAEIGVAADKVRALGVELAGLPSPKLKFEIVPPDRVPQIQGAPTELESKLSVSLGALGLGGLDEARKRAEGVGIALRQALDLRAARVEFDPQLDAMIAQLAKIRDEALGLKGVFDFGTVGDVSLPDVEAVRAAFDVMADIEANYNQSRIDAGLATSEEILGNQLAEISKWEENEAALAAQRIGDKQLLEEQLTLLHQAAENRRLAITQQAAITAKAMQLQAAATILNSLATVVGASGRQFRLMQALQAAATIANTAGAIMVAMAPPNVWPNTLIQASIAAAMGAAQLATIRAQKPSGFATGGVAFAAGGDSGRDTVNAIVRGGELMIDPTAAARVIETARAAGVTAATGPGGRGLTSEFVRFLTEPRQMFADGGMARTETLDNTIHAHAFALGGIAPGVDTGRDVVPVVVRGGELMIPPPVAEVMIANARAAGVSSVTGPGGKGLTPEFVRSITERHREASDTIKVHQQAFATGGIVRGGTRRAALPTPVNVSFPSLPAFSPSTQIAPVLPQATQRIAEQTAPQPQEITIHMEGHGEVVRALMDQMNIYTERGSGVLKVRQENVIGPRATR